MYVQYLLRSTVLCTLELSTHTDMYDRNIGNVKLIGYTYL